mgnify:CR=1 FL=1
MSSYMNDTLSNSVPQIFDDRVLHLKRRRASRHFDEYRFLFDQVSDSLSDRMLDIKREFETGLIFGANRLSARAQERIKKHGKFDNLFQTDFLDLQPKYGDGINLIAQEELLPLGRQKLDFIGSFLSLHTANDLPGALIQIKYALKPDGLFLGCLFGGETLYEMRQVLMESESRVLGGVSPRVMPFADKQQMGALLQRAGFALPVVDSDVLEVTYPDIYALMRDIRGMGETNIVKERSRQNPGKALFEKANDLYKQLYSDEQGRLIARFEIIYLIGWAPHESQQKPLRPGSAENSLAHALDTQEYDTDVPTGK